MKTEKNKITAKQLFFIFTIIVSSPATRLFPKFTSEKAAQAGWVSPLLGIAPFIGIIFLIDSLLKMHEGKSMADIIEAVMGKYVGRLICAMYLMWATLISAIYSRYYVERLTSSIYPNVNNNILIILTLIPIAYILRSGFTVIARMGEVLLPFIGVMLILLVAFLVPRIRLDNLIPVYFNDIIPVVKASASTIAILSYLFLLFFLSDNLVNLKSLKKFGYIAVFVNITSLVAVIFISVGVLGSSVAQRSPLPVLNTVKQVSILDTIENIEAIIVAIWIFADFTMISTFLTISLKLMKSIFKLSDTRPLINIFVILIYFLAMGLCSSKFELEKFTSKFLFFIDISMGFGIPILLFALSKLKEMRKRTKEAS